MSGLLLLYIYHAASVRMNTKYWTKLKTQILFTSTNWSNWITNDLDPIIRKICNIFLGLIWGQIMLKIAQICFWTLLIKYSNNIQSTKSDRILNQTIPLFGTQLFKLFELFVQTLHHNYHYHRNHAIICILGSRPNRNIYIPGANMDENLLLQLLLMKWIEW